MSQRIDVYHHGSGCGCSTLFWLAVFVGALGQLLGWHK